MWAANYGVGAALDGLPAGLKAFTAAVLGGIGNCRRGAGRCAAGLLEAIGAGYLGELTGGVLGSHYVDIFAFVALILVLTLRPSGLLGERVATAPEGAAMTIKKTPPVAAGPWPCGVAPLLAQQLGNGLGAHHGPGPALRDAGPGAGTSWWATRACWTWAMWPSMPWALHMFALLASPHLAENFRMHTLPERFAHADLDRDPARARAGGAAGVLLGAPRQIAARRLPWPS